MDGLIELFAVSACDGRKDTPCVESAKKTVCDLFSGYGYEWAAFAQRPVANFDDPEEAVFYFTTYPENYVSHYWSNGYQLYDPIMRCTELSSNVFTSQTTWEKAKELCLASPLGDAESDKDDYKKKVEEVYESCSDHGMKSGLIFVEELDGLVVTLSLGHPEIYNPTEKVINELAAALFLIARIFDNTKGCKRCGRAETDLSPLTSKEIVSLRVVLDNPNLSIKEIATKSGRSASTLKSHLWRVRQKLDKKDAKAFNLAQYCKNKGLI